MADSLDSSAPDRRSGGSRRVVSPLSRAGGRPCSRPGCPAPSRATLVFDYGRREAWLQALAAERRPQAYDLCGHHADRTSPPHGWQLRDQRPEDPETPQRPGELASDTVSVLAAALRRAPGEDEDEDPLRAALEEVQAVPTDGPAEDPAPTLDLDRPRRSRRSRRGPTGPVTPGRAPLAMRDRTDGEPDAPTHAPHDDESGPATRW